MKKTTRMLALALLLALCLTTSALAEGQLRVGMECNYAPYNWTQTDDSNGAVAIENGGFAGGYDVEVAKYLAEKLDKELVIVKTEWDGLIPALQSDMIDVVIAGMSPTEKRKLTVDFSDLYYETQLVVVVRKEGAYADAKTLADFADAKITGQLNTVHYEVIDQLTGCKKQPAMDSFPTMIVALSSGVIDGYISELPGAMSACASNPDLSYVELTDGFVMEGDDSSVAIAIKKGREDVLAQINAALAELPADQRTQLMADAVTNQPAAE